MRLKNNSTEKIYAFFYFRQIIFRKLKNYRFRGTENLVNKFEVFAFYLNFSIS